MTDTTCVVCMKEKEIATIEEQVKAVFKRIDEQSQMTKAVWELTSEIKIMNVEMKEMREDQAESKAEISTIKKDVEEIKMKPAKSWEWLKGAVGGIIVAAITALVLNAIGLI